ncbi:hypothetical protein J6590_050102 [Homalodisca vitripennis]|nr:hypothetical protein J6590_050102 [Homalodisca vitripennis]
MLDVIFSLRFLGKGLHVIRKQTTVEDLQDKATQGLHGIRKQTTVEDLQGYESFLRSCYKQVLVNTANKEDRCPDKVTQKWPSSANRRAGGRWGGNTCRAVCPCATRRCLSHINIAIATGGQEVPGVSHHLTLPPHPPLTPTRHNQWEHIISMDMGISHCHGHNVRKHVRFPPPLPASPHSVDPIPGIRLLYYIITNTKLNGVIKSRYRKIFTEIPPPPPPRIVPAATGLSPVAGTGDRANTLDDKGDIGRTGV